MEMTLLQVIQSWHNPVLDKIMVLVFNDFVGVKGEIWVILGLILFLIPRTRRCGICVLVSYLLAYFIGDGILKELIGRIRPCNADPSVPLIVKRPSSYSCPSVHSMLAFASAVSVFMNYKRAGIFTLVFAAMIGFSRMYFFVHYPTDVLFGALLGTLIGYCVCRLTAKQIKQI
ncbi:MAG: phosphatase PAP2 family protein [Bullifex sp.]